MFMCPHIQSRAVAHGPAGQAMAGPVFGDVLYFFPLGLVNVALLILQRDPLFDRSLENKIHTDIQYVLT